MKYRACDRCGETFMPAEMGYNARYCSALCKGRARRYREGYKPSRRKASYQRTQADPDRYQKHLESGRNARAYSRNWLADYKLETGCVDCGYNEHHAALQLDHEGEKRIKISDARSSIKRLKQEIASGKCVVRCAVCHAVRTWERKQHGVPTKRIVELFGDNRTRADRVLIELAWAVEDLANAIREFNNIN